MFFCCAVVGGGNVGFGVDIGADVVVLGVAVGVVVGVFSIGIVNFVDASFVVAVHAVGGWCSLLHKLIRLAVA